MAVVLEVTGTVYPCRGGQEWSQHQLVSWSDGIIHVLGCGDGFSGGRHDRGGWLEFLFYVGGNIMIETEKQQECRYCHGDSLFIMNMDDDEADVWVSGNVLKVSVYDTCGAYINYCPICGRKLK